MQERATTETACGERRGFSKHKLEGYILALLIVFENKLFLMFTYYLRETKNWPTIAVNVISMGKIELFVTKLVQEMMTYYQMPSS